MYKSFLLSLLFLLSVSITYAENTPINRIFPLQNYSQDLNDWFNSNYNNYKHIYLDKETQRHYFKLLKENYYGKNSPWSSSYIKFIINPEPKTEKTIHKGLTLILNLYKSNIGDTTSENANTLYGMNYRKLNNTWFQNVTNNVNLKQFQRIVYNPKNRAITTNNVAVTSLPTIDAGFNNYTIPGSGYPFNLFNLSYLSAGTPVYIFGTSKDKAWYFIIAPATMGWVKSKDIAHVDNNFINNWVNYSNKSLSSIITTNLPIIDTNNNYQFSALVGTLLPIYSIINNKMFKVMIPVKNSNGRAIIKYSILNKINAVKVPLPITMENFSKVVKTLIGRPYGWGGIDFYSDCSLEIISIYKTFGILLTRNSASQATFSGQMIDISKLPPTERLDMIAKNSIPFATLLYFKGHIMIYIGTYKTSFSENTIMTYQNIWGLAPKDKSWRDIIGQAVIFPLLLQYPETPDDSSLIAKDNFIIINLIKPSYKPIGLSSLLY